VRHPQRTAWSDYNSVSLNEMVSLDTVLNTVQYVKILPQCLHTSSYTKYVPVVHNIMSTCSCIRDKTCSFHVTSHTFPQLWGLHTEVPKRICMFDSSCLQHHEYIAWFLAKWKECVHNADLAWLCIKTLAILLCTKKQCPATSCCKPVSNHISYFVTIHCYSQSFNPHRRGKNQQMTQV